MSWPDFIRNNIRAPLLENINLRERTTINIAGFSQYFVEPEDVADVAAIMNIRKDTGFNLNIIGGGSNLLIAGGLIRGLFLSTRKLSGINDFLDNGKNIFFRAASGTEVKKILSAAFSHYGEGLEHLIGIPGTLGGAITGNAGTTGLSISDNIQWIDTIESDGTSRRWKKEEIDWDYRYCSLNSSERIITGCGIVLHKGKREIIKKRYRSFWDLRKNQPYHCRSAGCIFKNPAGHSAGKLLDESGCKGLKYGRAKVSDIHANFIVNMDNANYDDTKKLINECQRRVKEHSGIDLELEVKLIDA